MISIGKTSTVICFLLCGILILGCDMQEKQGKADTASAGKADEHGEHDEGGGHEGHDDDEPGAVRMTKEARETFGVTMSVTGSARINTYLTLPGEISVNQNRFAHVVPRVGGVVTEVRKNWGDAVKKGETLAILDSRELGSLKASYLASVERLSLSKALFERETRLWKKKITSEQEYLNAKRNFADANITYREKRQALIVLGVPTKHIDNARLSDDNSLTRYEITAPFAGIVIDKHLALGEAVEANSTVFQIGDLREVWANLSVYQKDLDKVKKGTFVIVAGHDNTPEGKGEITYVQPVLGEQTRTAIARVTLDNSDGKWRPGLFIEGKIAISSFDVPLAVTPGALQKKEGATVVFVEEKEGLLTPHKVVTGRGDGIHVEIVSGLSVGESYVSEGSFVVKAESEKESFGGEGHHH